ncbi:MAG: esterase-like activity of phytase family protein [Prochlorococcaceae cyanobacterium]|jgi:hypothetical protein
MIPAAPPPALPLPACPVPLRWELIHTRPLPRDAGGFSGATYRPEEDALWVVSDAPQGELLVWRGLKQLAAGDPADPELLARIPLRGSPVQPLPEAIDGEALVLGDGAVWVVSEGRLEPSRAALLLRFDARSGELQGSLPLPANWQPRPHRGLEPNGGPESLTLWPVFPLPGQAATQLLLAAEHPLQQDRPKRTLRTLLWALQPGGAEVAEHQLPPLPIPPGTPALGLTDLLSLPPQPQGGGRLLALWRGFEAPARWRAELSLLELGAAGWRERGRWDLLAAGLPADNWEAITPGPVLADGRRSLLLLSDDNFNPLQQNHIALLAPRCPAAPDLP